MHQPGIAGPEHVVVDAPPGGDTRCEPVDHDIGAPRQLDELVAPGIGSQVDDDALFSPAPDEEA